MSELTKIIIVSCKHFAQALMQIAKELESPNSQAPIIDSLKLYPPEKESLKVGDSVMVLIKKRRITVDIDRIDGGQITATNSVMGKTWTVDFTDIIHKHK